MSKIRILIEREDVADWDGVHKGSLEVWYDRRVRSWVVQYEPTKEYGDTLTTYPASDYVYTRDEAEAIADYAETQGWTRAWRGTAKGKGTK